MANTLGSRSHLRHRKDNLSQVRIEKTHLRLGIVPVFPSCTPVQNQQLTVLPLRLKAWQLQPGRLGHKRLTRRGVDHHANLGLGVRLSGGLHSSGLERLEAFADFEALADLEALETACPKIFRPGRR